MADLPSEEYPVTILHTPCQEPLFYYSHRPVGGERIVTTAAVLLDGTKPVTCTTIWCRHCQEVVLTRDMSAQEPWGVQPVTERSEG